MFENTITAMHVEAATHMKSWVKRSEIATHEIVRQQDLRLTIQYNVRIRCYSDASPNEDELGESEAPGLSSSRTFSVP